MKHRVTSSQRHRILLHIAIVATLLTTGTACEKSISPVEAPAGIGADPIEVTPEGVAAGLLTRINIGNNGIVQQISYNSRQQPLVMTRYAGNLLTEKDSVIYNTTGKLQKIIHYTPDFFKKGKFTVSGNTTFEWNNNNKIVKKLFNDQESSTQEDTRYTYDATGKVHTISTTTASKYDNLKVLTTLYYEQTNVVRITRSGNGQAISELTVIAVDGQQSYVTGSLLPYLLDIVENEAFSEQNASETKNIQYVNFNNKRDTIVTITKNSFQYNTQKRPVKNTFTSTIYSPGNPKPVTSAATIDYTYGK
ncbi:hypothetical protein KTO58_15545 [Chitinophaga pendula]|uniref:hypothetical protein n=1 Tax=Chitinophaga TaxID=79328 RepID=UPI000BAF8307|nr:MULTISPECIES: hypothetical protein [Chitinophaga]ASZ11865.1 hypothetical protein CK934_13305 [Chitinophaga sp. MD30]UCJ05110.1 hypothetical protein KTO58_15545 [Chitinophaga pendula]